MNKFLMTIKNVIIVMSITGIAHADYPSSTYLLLNSWTGFYSGVAAGGVINNIELNSEQLGFTNLSEQCNTHTNFSSFFPGIQLGYVYQFKNNFVAGMETNVTVNTNMSETLSCDCPNNSVVSDRFSFSNQMQTSIKGRIGRAVNWKNHPVLPYLTTGVSFANLRLTYQNEGNDYYAKNDMTTGWLVGTGIEWAFKEHWSLRAEYSYICYGEAIHLDLPSIYELQDPNGHAHVNLSTNNVMIAINYWI